MDEDARFAAALADCCQRVRSGEALDACLSTYPAAYRAELARLVPVTERVSRLRDEPAPAFKARLADDLLARVDAARAGRQRQTGGFFRFPSAWRVAALALVALLVFAASSATMVAASDETLPDNPLYGVKTAKESVELVLATNPEAKVNVNASHLVTRSRELAVAVRRGKPQPVVEVLSRRVAASVNEMVNQAVALRAAGRPAPAVRALAALRFMDRELGRLANGAAPDVQNTLIKLRQQIQREQSRLEPRPTV